MFERRLRWFVIVVGGLALAIAVRLVDIQVVHAARYADLASTMLTRPVQYLDATRGSILDRAGRTLISDIPTFDISIHYAALLALHDESDENTILPATKRYLVAVARTMRKNGDVSADRLIADITPELESRLRSMWPRLSELTGVPLEDLSRRADQIRRRVTQIRRNVGQPIREEGTFHALVRNVADAAALRAQLELEPDHPWLIVVPSSKRVVSPEAASLIHVVGRMGAAGQERIDRDRVSDIELDAAAEINPLAREQLWPLRPGDRCGISGIERVAETMLRGTRGGMIRDFNRRTVLERAEPVRGRDVRLTIDADLQRRVLDILAAHVSRSDHPAGASAVVIDVQTRDVLALVSYPVYRNEDFGDRGAYAALRRDTLRMPLRFRAVSGQYPPGSTCKVIGMYGVLADQLVTSQSEYQCTGHLLPDQPDAFRCWIYRQYGATHGPQKAAEALQNSCNIYLYKAGEALGPERLCEWFTQWGLGHTQGTGLIEEAGAVVPDEAWLLRRRGREHRKADAWNYAIGQGEVTATPLQTANVAATVASGRWAPVRLLSDASGNPMPFDDQPVIQFDERLMRTIREGMWRVVNDPRGTGRAARLDDGDHVFCGKTGSAQTSRRVVSRKYTWECPDGRRAEVIAPTKEDALAQLNCPDAKIVSSRIHELFPAAAPGEKLPAHALFIGYTQRKDVVPGDPPRGKSYAISVVIEFGSSGGAVAGPVAKEIAEVLLADYSGLE